MNIDVSNFGKEFFLIKKFHVSKSLRCFNIFKKEVSRCKKCRKVQKYSFVIFQRLQNVFKKNVSKVSGLPQFRKLYKFQSVIKLLKHGRFRAFRWFNTFLIFFKLHKL
jgi:hypothetical protein